MRLHVLLISAFALVLPMSWAGAALASSNASVASPEKPLVLVAAVGQRFTSVTQVKQTGSHLPPYRRQLVDAPDQVLNRIVLQGLDDSIAAVSPKTQRVLLSVPIPITDYGDAAVLERAAIEHVIASLRAMPRREDWGKVVVMTPAYRSMGRDGLGDRLRGLGLFYQTQCESNDVSCSWGSRPASGPQALTKEGETRPANFFVAPYSYLKCWVLDPVSLEVLEQYESLEHQKLAVSGGVMLDMRDLDNRAFIAKNIQTVVYRSVEAAVAQTELVGKISLGEVREVRDAKAQK
ncbi:MAG: hypothetical protein JNN20_08890 [Betaproteobacteria bacterium]|nr:hypothetical protein [Betaproteobacteria bacterium]